MFYPDQSLHRTAKASAYGLTEEKPAQYGKFSPQARSAKPYTLDAPVLSQPLESSLINVKFDPQTHHNRPR
jgi:hypothetical protein